MVKLLLDFGNNSKEVEMDFKKLYLKKFYDLKNFIVQKYPNTEHLHFFSNNKC